MFIELQKIQRQQNKIEKLVQNLANPKNWANKSDYGFDCLLCGNFEVSVEDIVHEDTCPVLAAQKFIVDNQIEVDYII